MQETQMMHNAIAHHPVTDAQPIPEQQLCPPSQQPPVYVLVMMVHRMEYPFGSSGQLPWPCSLPASCAAPQWQSMGNQKVLGLG